MESTRKIFDIVEGKEMEGELDTLYERLDGVRICEGVRADREFVNIKDFPWVDLVVNDWKQKKITDSSAVKIENEFRNRKECKILFTKYAQAVLFSVREQSV